MGLNLARIHSFIEKEVRSDRSLPESMERVIATCEKAQPHDDWNEFRAVEFEKSGRRLATRVKGWFANRKLKAKINGLWFGIYNPENGRWPIADFRVVGASTFVADKDDNSWAADTSTWSPTDRAYSMNLKEYYKIAHREQGLGNSAEYPICLAYTTLAIRDLMMTSKPSVFLRNATSVGVAVGFDSGDFIVLGTLTKDGLSLTD